MMETLLLPASDPRTFQTAGGILARGGLVAFPTDTVYGLGTRVFDGPAVERIYAAKQRPVEKAIPVLIGTMDGLLQIVPSVPVVAQRLASRFWPGPLTLVLPKRPEIPVSVSAGETIGVRIPDLPVARSLLCQAGPMAVTSANLSGQASPCTAAEVMLQLNGRIDLVIDGGRTPGGVPSTVVDCLGTDLKILREGPLSLDQLLAAAGKDL